MMVYKWSIITAAVGFVGILMYVGGKPNNTPADTTLLQPQAELTSTTAPSPFVVVNTPVEPEPSQPAPAQRKLDKRPTVNAGNDFAVESLELVELEGRGKAYDDSSVTYQWMTYPEYRMKMYRDTYVSSRRFWHKLELHNTNQFNVKFVAPLVDSRHEVMLFLVVTDKMGRWSSDAITVTVMPKELPYTAFHEFDMPDEGLRKCVDEVASLMDMSFARELSELNCKSHNIENLEGIEHLLALRKLYLPDNNITDISKLSALKRLFLLDLGRNQVFDLRPLSVLPRLHLLFLNDNAIIDIEPLAKINQLAMLNLKSNKIFDLKPLKNFASLQELNLSQNVIHDLNGLDDLINIRKLQLANNPFKRIYPLWRLSKLESLDLRFTENVQCADIDALVNRVELEVKQEGDCRM